ncbi:MAG: endo-1,4-beta-xylanase [Treponema sp.]|nr:endo-1,4-beta-xylanase [Treponema sp.]
MKKIRLSLASAILFLCAASLHAAPAVQTGLVKNEDGTYTATKIDEDKKAIKYGQKVDGFKDVTVVKGSAVTKQNPISVSLDEVSNQELNISLSGEIKISGKSDSYDAIWMINDFDAGFPELSRKTVKNNEWTHFEGKTTICVGQNKQLYLSKTGISMDEVTFYLKNFSVKIETEGALGPKVSWLEVPSLKEAYKDFFKFGLAVTYKGELNNPDVQDGLYRHVESITLGNAFKPDFLFAWQNPTVKMAKYTDETGKTIDVPALLPKFNDMDAILGLAKMNNLKIRGHVLVWHSQTPHWFFTEGYSSSKDAPYVDKETMTARQEWYIRSVLEHVAEWEQKNKCKEHVVWAWDVVNEAAADNSSEARFLREDSDWYRVYKNEEFIVNAFRFANKYAPKDVQLVYNDYGTYSGSNRTKGTKHASVLKIIDAIQANPETRLDAVGMQSHINQTYPKITGDDSFERAIQNFLAKGIDVQITELDMGHQTKYSPIRQKTRYKEIFEMFIRNRKVDGKNGISSVTLWGLTDNSTWLDNQPEYKSKNNKQHPLLFEGTEFFAKPSYYGVMEAAEEAKN